MSSSQSESNSATKKDFSKALDEGRPVYDETSSTSDQDEDFYAKERTRLLWGQDSSSDGTGSSECESEADEVESTGTKNTADNKERVKKDLISSSAQYVDDEWDKLTPGA